MLKSRAQRRRSRRLPDAAVPAAAPETTPTGPAGGDLAGSYPNPTVADLTHVVAAGNFCQFYLQETDPLGKDGDFWFHPLFQTLKIKIAGTWTNIAGGAEIGLGTFQPAVGHPYRTTTGNDGGTDSLANAIANNWNVEDGLLKP